MAANNFVVFVNIIPPCQQSKCLSLQNCDLSILLGCLQQIFKLKSEPLFTGVFSSSFAIDQSVFA